MTIPATKPVPGVEIPVENWVDLRVDEDGLAPRLLATLKVEVGFQQVAWLHVTAICVSDPDQAGDRPYFQEAMNSEDQEDFAMLFQLCGANQPLEVVRIGGAGDNRTFVVFAEPFES